MDTISNEIRWVVFDLGGVVVPETGGLICNEMAGYLRISPAKVSGFSSRYKRETTKGEMSLLEMYSAMIREMELPFSPEDVLKHHLAFYQQVSTHHNSEVIWIIEMLKRDLGVACLTNTEREIAEICKTNGLFDYFHKAFLSVDMGMQKPDLEIYEEVARSVGCLPAEIFFVDDNMENVQAAIDVGMHGYLYCDVEKFWKALSCFCRLI